MKGLRELCFISGQILSGTGGGINGGFDGDHVGMNAEFLDFLDRLRVVGCANSEDVFRIECPECSDGVRPVGMRFLFVLGQRIDDFAHIQRRRCGLRAQRRFRHGPTFVAATA